MSFQLAIFDLDGTILNTLEDLAAALNHGLKAFGLPHRTVDEVRRFVGNGMGLLIHRGVPAGTSPQTEKQVLSAFHQYYKEHCTDFTRPYNGIPELLRELHSHGVKTAVVSNKADYGVQELCANYFPDMFDTAVGERTGIAKKPDPSSVLEVLRLLNIPREQAVYIGDSDVDIETAKNAHMPCISVEWGFRDRAFLTAHGAQKIVSSPGELLPLIL